ncbi:MAG TPA: hypothetical protein VMI13_08145 [Solirubrobacteraceae bacterium]|nr:hypothetical protein [Solirubrobacteraceae bacterium]
MIASLHMRELESSVALRTLVKGRIGGVSGLLAGEVVLASPLTERLLPRPDRHRVAAFAFWTDEEALERFQEEHEAGIVLAAGWQMRMQPMRIFGSWRGLEAIEGCPVPMDPDEPVAALTLGRLRPSQVVRFLKASARAERDALAGGAMLASSGLARPPRLVSTFSVWHSFAAMREYIAGSGADGHRQAVRSHAERPFHSESAFVRLRPLEASGEAPWWPGLGAFQSTPASAVVPSPA